MTTSHNARNNGTNSRNESLSKVSIVMAAVVVVFGFGMTSATASIIANAPSKDNNGFVSLKLRPRHAELERRKRERERSLSVEEKVEEDSREQDWNEERYRRREEAVQVGALFEVGFICGWISFHFFRIGFLLDSIQFGFNWKS